MRIHLVTVLFLAGLSAACAGSKPTDDTVDTDPDGDSDTTYVPDTGDTGGGGGGGGNGNVDVTFTEGRYQVDELVVLATGGVDLDGDGTVDNQVGGLLEAIGRLGSLGISLDDVNANIQTLLDRESAIVLMHVEHTGDVGVRMDIVQGQRDVTVGLIGLAESYEGGEPKQRFLGAFDEPDHFTTVDGDIELPLQFYIDEPAIMVSATQVRSDVTIKETGLEGYLAGAFPVDRVLSEIVEPLVFDFYWYDTNQAENLLDLLRPLIVSAADIDVETEAPKLSGAFSFRAHEEDWADPTP